MSLLFRSKVPSFIAKNDLAMDFALAAMAQDIERLSKMQVPHDTGALQNSIRHIKVAPKHYQVDVGLFPVNIPYARRWEFETPPHGFKKGRKSRYLRDPGQLIASKAISYFKQAVGAL